MKTRNLRPSRQPSLRRDQQGVVLLVALILLIVMTLLGLTAMRSSSLEERMAAHSYDRSLSFQAAEAALRVGESVAEAHAAAAPFVAPATGCSNGICSTPVASDTPRWEDSSFTGWQTVTSTDKVKSGAIEISPSYIVEYLGNTFPCRPEDPTSGTSDCKRYRVTAKADPGDGRAMVILQSVYATE